MTAGDTPKILMVGGGRMGEALLGGAISAGTAPNDLAVVEPLAARRRELAAALPGVAVLESPVPALGAVLAVKPGIVSAAAETVAEVGIQRVLSVAGGVRTASIEEAGGGRLRVVRGMPNTPALVGAGAAAICAGKSATEQDLEWAKSVLGSVGVVVSVPEDLIDAVTGLRAPAPPTSSSSPRLWWRPGS